MTWCHHIPSELAGYKSYPLSAGSTRRVQRNYDDNDYKLKLGCWRIHGLWARNILPIHYLVRFDDILWLIEKVSLLTWLDFFL